jgi:hypothetical protein
LTGISPSFPDVVTTASASPALVSAFFRRAGYSGKPSGSVDRTSTSISSAVPSSSRIAM